MSLPTLPATLNAEVNGAKCTISGRPNKAKTRVWYSGSRVVEQTTRAPEKALGRIVVSLQGNVLKAGDVHTSAAQVYPAGHKLAGQEKPWTGGNPTVTHSGVLTLKDSEGNDHHFTVMVTVTYIGPDSRAVKNAGSRKPAKVGFVTVFKAIPQAEHAPTMEVDGDLSFVDEDDLVSA